MNQPLNISNNKNWLWYTCYAAVMTVFFLYVLFPSRALTDYVRTELESRYPEINVSFKKIGVSVSPGINIRGLKIALRENPGTPVYVSEKTSVRVSIPGWLTGDPKYFFKSKVQGGEISGFIEQKEIAKKERIESTINFKDIKLDENVFIDPVISQTLEGTLTGEIKYIGDLPDLLRGNAEISADMTDGSIKLVKPFLGMDTVEFKKISLSGVLDNRRLTIKDLNMTGGPFSGSATGTVQINNNFPSSRLNLRAEIEPSPSLMQENPNVGKAIDLVKNQMKGGKLPVNIRGTIERRLYNFR